ncbi:MAG: DinB family protein, partial [Planctomycetota bacterium]
FYAPLREVVSITRDGAESARRVPAAEDAELLALWRDLRTRTAAIARALRPDHLSRTLGEGGDTLGRILRHLAGTTTYWRLHLQGRADEDVIKLWDPSFTPERLAAELETDREEFLDEMPRHLPREREKLRRMIRHEAWHQGQVAAAVRDSFPPDAVWRL